MLSEFMQFLKTYNVIGLALAVIIGGKANALAGAFVNDLVTPLLANLAIVALALSLSWLAFRRQELGG